MCNSCQVMTINMRAVWDYQHISSSIKQGAQIFQKSRSHLQNSRRQKGETKKVPYWRSKNPGWPEDLTPWVCRQWYNTPTSSSNRTTSVITVYSQITSLVWYIVDGFNFALLPRWVKMHTFRLSVIVILKLSTCLVANHTRIYKIILLLSVCNKCYCDI